MARFGYALDGCKICGPPNGLEYLKEVLKSDVFRAGAATTTFLNDFPFTPWRVICFL
jgi:urea carboxylase